MSPLAGTEDHAHARMALESALAGGPSHAYLFHGPAGVGKGLVARAFAAELLAEGAGDPEDVRRRVESGVHPDLTWVTPTGAHEMRLEDVDEPVIAAATRTPFESKRRVFVLERADTMSDRVANRLLKTLEEPAPFVHLILLTDAMSQVIPTVVSRCQLVRFDALPAARIQELLVADGVAESRARACARLALGNGARARWLASDEGAALLADVDAMVKSALAGSGESWEGLNDRAKARGAERAEAMDEQRKKRLESEPKGRDRTALERQFEDAAKREKRRGEREILDLGLGLLALTLRDLICLAEDAPEAALDSERAEKLASAAHGRDPRRLREAAERCEEVRLSLELNVTEELALSALSYRLAGLVGSPA
ncbi:MAG: DNA polymerase III subunit [Solirubrobacteraceae bacterium]